MNFPPRVFLLPLALYVVGTPLGSGQLKAQDTFAPTGSSVMEANSVLSPFPKDGIVPLKTIAGDFFTNAVAATGKYSGRRITVSGRIQSLQKGHGYSKALIVTLQGRTASLPAVKAEFLSGSLPENSELDVSGEGGEATLLRRDRYGMILSRTPYLSVGQKVEISGSFKDLNVGDIVLTDCKLKHGKH